MSEFPSLPLFTDAFIADTGHLSALETGAYLMLLMMAWRSSDCRLPDDDARLARWARVDGRTWSRIKSTVLEFWTLEDGFWTQKRLSKERGVVSKRAEVARHNGAHGGRPKSLKDNEAENPAGSVRVTQQKAPNPNPSRSKKDSDADASGAAAPPDPSKLEREYFERGRQVLGQKAGAMLANLLRAKGGNPALARAALEEASQKHDPMAFIGRILHPAQPFRRVTAQEELRAALDEYRIPS